MRRTLEALRKSRDASVAPTLALSLFALVAAGGIAFDYAHMAALDTELQDAADQAALAAASQLDGTNGSMQRASAAAQSLLTNSTVFANDANSSGTAVTVPTISFFQTADDAENNTNAFTDTSNFANAHYVKVAVATRRAYFALTPVVGAISSPDLGAEAVAGMKGAICRVPPMMICNPKPGTTFDADAMKGVGFSATGHGNGNSGSSTNSGWAPGDFGFLAVTTSGNANGQNSDLLKALAMQAPTLKCYYQDTGQVTTGNPQNAYDAINTRFDIYNFPANSNGNTLSVACSGGNCPAALDVTKDLVNQNNQNNFNCGLQTGASTKGWQLPNKQFSPRAALAGDTATTTLDSDNNIDAMGLPRDDCHYTSYGVACSAANGTSGSANATDKLGDGKWARADYFGKYHAANKPANWATMTRYETYAWELGTGNIPSVSAGGSLKQYGAPTCSTGTPTPGTDRRVLSVAVVNNCAQLNGASLGIALGGWADVFLVEPTISGRANGDSADSIYVEIIGKTKASGDPTQAALVIERQVPYLVK